MKTLLLCLLLSLSSFIGAKTPELIAVATDQGGYPAKALCFFSNTNMVAHPEGLLVLYTCFGGPDINSEIWLVKDKPALIGTSAFGNLLTEPYVRGKDIYFFEYSEHETISLSHYSEGSLSKKELPENLKSSHVHDFALLGETFYFRYTNRSIGEHGEGVYTDDFKVLPGRDPLFYFRASSNGEVMIQKTMLASGEAIELRTKNNPEPVVILKNRDADPASPFKVLRYQFALRGSKWATIATTDKGLTLLRGENASYTTEDLSAHFKDIQYWPPALTAQGEIIFRGTDHSGQFALWGFKDGKKRVVIGSGLEITEGGETVITSSRSLLYNSPVIDQNGRMYIGVGLKIPGASGDFGQGIIAF